MKKAEKKDFVKTIVKELEGAKSTVFVDTAKLGVKPQQSLQNELKKSGSKMFIVKNTLLKIAGKEVKFPEEALSDSVLTGQTAVIVSKDDPVAAIQILGKFLKTSEFPQPKAGIVEGKFTDKAGIMAISKLPGKQELYGQVVGSIMNPAYGLVGALQGNLQKLVWILQSKASQS
jgi:large subunit ribosomal protein L10